MLLVSLMFSVLYWAAPNVKQPGFRWITPGGVVAVLLWIAASAAFAFYVANFGSYNKTYGTLGGVIVFLVWLWISNIAVLLGAELNAELERARELEQGRPPSASCRSSRATRRSRLAPVRRGLGSPAGAVGGTARAGLPPVLPPLADHDLDRAAIGMATSAPRTPRASRQTAPRPAR